MKRLLLVAALALAGLSGSRPAAAQVRPELDLNFDVGFPQGSFGEQLDNPGFGLNLFGGVGVGRTPVVVGADVAFLIYGLEHREEPFSPTIPDVTVDVNTTNNIVMGHFVLRVQPPSGAVRPYLDGLVGVKYLFTQTQIESENGADDPIAASTNFDDAAFSYGAGGGLDVRLFDGPMGEERHHVLVALNVGVRYLFGGEASYLKKGSIRRQGGRVTYDVSRSETDLLVPHLGVRFAF